MFRMKLICCNDSGIPLCVMFEQQIFDNERLFVTKKLHSLRSFQKAIRFSWEKAAMFSEKDISRI